MDDASAVDPTAFQPQLVTVFIPLILVMFGGRAIGMFIVLSMSFCAELTELVLLHGNVIMNCDVIALQATGEHTNGAYWFILPACTGTYMCCECMWGPY